MSTRVGRSAGALVLAALLLAGAGAQGSSDALARGDAAWARRAEGERDGLPQPGPIGSALRAYGQALEAEPESIEARWKLLRALYFAGDFAKPGAERKREIFERGRRVAEAGLEVVERRIASPEPFEELEPGELARRVEQAGVDRRDVARFYFWAAVNWGAWSRTVGLLSAVRRGVTSRLHRYTEITIALEPDYEAGAGYRLLGRLHAELPRVPLLTGWVDRDLSVPLAERAYDLAPENPGNRLLLALTLLDLAPERGAQARELLRQVETLEPRPAWHIEDLAVRELARERIEAEDAT